MTTQNTLERSERSSKHRNIPCQHMTAWCSDGNVPQIGPQIYYNPIKIFIAPFFYNNDLKEFIQKYRGSRIAKTVL